MAGLAAWSGSGKPLNEVRAGPQPVRVLVLLVPYPSGAEHPSTIGAPTRGQRRVPDGITVHQYWPPEGGSFLVTAPGSTSESAAHTDAYHGLSS